MRCDRRKYSDTEDNTERRLLPLAQSRLAAVSFQLGIIVHVWWQREEHERWQACGRATLMNHTRYKGANRSYRGWFVIITFRHRKFDKITKCEMRVGLRSLIGFTMRSIYMQNRPIN